jgi:hypothetical protein
LSLARLIRSTALIVAAWPAAAAAPSPRVVKTINRDWTFQL